MDSTERQEVFRLRKEGKTLREIGLVFGVSHQWISQILQSKPKEKNPGDCFSCRKFFDDIRHSHGKFVFCNACWHEHFVRSSGTRLEGLDMTRQVVRIRDNHTCQSCKAVWTPDRRRFDVHHLGGHCGKKSYSYDRVEDVDSLITLCHKCHMNLPEVREKTLQRNGNVKVYFVNRYAMTRKWQIENRGS